MRNIIIRTLSGIVFIFIVIFCLVKGTWYSGPLFGVFALISFFEFQRLTNRGKKIVFLESVAIIGVLLIYVSAWLSLSGLSGFDWRMLLIPWMLLTVVIALFSEQKVWWNQLSSTWVGLAYTAGSFSLITATAYINGSYDYVIPLGIFIIIWIADTAAFLSGTFFGKNKMIPRLSPGKTWEGTAGAIVFALITAYVMDYFFGPMETGNWYVLALVVSISGIVGDLFESRLKRTAGVKDSGKIMPGHGGALDRFDAVLFAMPCAWIYLSIVG